MLPVGVIVTLDVDGIEVSSPVVTIRPAVTFDLTNLSIAAASSKSLFTDTVWVAVGVLILYSL